MNKLSGIICNCCKVVINSHPKLEQRDETFHLCEKCNSILCINARISELEKSREYLAPSYYWIRVKELQDVLAKYKQTDVSDKGLV
jgi:hypothetical protein